MRWCGCETRGADGVVEHFAQGIGAWKLLSEERTKPVKLTLAGGGLKLSAYHPDFGEAEESLEVEYAGEEIVIGFNSRYMLDALTAQEGDQILLELKDGLSPGVVRGFEEVPAGFRPSAAPPGPLLLRRHLPGARRPLRRRSSARSVGCRAA